MADPIKVSQAAHDEAANFLQAYEADLVELSHSDLSQAFTAFEQAIRADQIERDAKLAEVYSTIHVEKRDDALATGKEVGALSFARQAQTCDELATAIRSQKGEK